MTAQPSRCLGILALIGCLVTAVQAQPQRPQITFATDYNAAVQSAKKLGLPIMVYAKGKADELPVSLTDAKVAARASSFVPVLLVADGAVAKKLNLSKGCVAFLDGEGKSLAELEAGFTSDQLLEKMAVLLEGARAKALERINNDKKSAAGHKAAFETYVRLGAKLPDIIPLVAHKNPAVKSAAGTMLTARQMDGADWFLLNAMTSNDADFRAAIYPFAIVSARSPKVPAAKFWKEASEEERSAALDKWREAVFGKVPPINKEIADFCWSNMGNQVNDGECAMLATDAFKIARAKPKKNEGKTYIWGKPLPANETALVGDIVQLEDAKVGKMSYSHHTQVIRRVIGPKQYEVFEQNVSGRRTVGKGNLNLATLTSGSVVIYRPIPIDEKSK